MTAFGKITQAERGKFLRDQPGLRSKGQSIPQIFQTPTCKRIQLDLERPNSIPGKLFASIVIVLIFFMLFAAFCQYPIKMMMMMMMITTTTTMRMETHIAKACVSIVSATALGYSTARGLKDQ